MLELGEGDVVEELDQELARDILLIGRESFDGNEDGGGSNDEDKKGMDARSGQGADLDGQRIGWGQVGRFVSGRGWEIWHS